MNRRFAFATIALGSVVSLMGGTGILAVFTDRATTGTNSAASGARASAADLQIATATQSPSGFICGDFVDDQTTGLFDVADAQPTEGLLASQFICLRNAGSSSLSVFLGAIDLVDSETDCTGDEAAAGDTTCGPNQGPGELSSVLFVENHLVNCTTGLIGGGSPILLADLASGVVPFDISLVPGDVWCFRLGVSYPTNRPDTDVLIAQTDKAMWRFAYDGRTS